MATLVDEIASRIRDTVRSSVASLRGEKQELRTVFHGPPISYLRAVYEILSAGGGIAARLPSGDEVIVPVLLQVEALPPGAVNPPVGMSGECDESHPLALRNSPDCPRFVTLVPPGRHSSLSFTSASNEFGLSAESNSGNATIDSWWSDRFVQALVGSVLRGVASSPESQQGGQKLIEHAIRSADEIDEHDVGRQRAWDVLARVMSISAPDREFGRQLSLACGVPPVDDGSIQADEQLECLAKIARTLADDGFRPGIEQLKQGVEDERDRSALDEFLTHLQRVCDLQSAFDRVPQFFYAPSQSKQLPSAPAWWEYLTVERWTEILQEDRQPTGSLAIKCTNSIVPRMPGLDAVVLDEACITVSSPEGAAGVADLIVIRQVGGAAGRRDWHLSLPDEPSVVDREIPPHRTAVRYSAEAMGYRKSSIKVISMRGWVPGVIPSCRTARKVWLPKKAKPNRAGVAFECSLELVGRGRHYIDLYVRPGLSVGGKAFGGDDVGLDETGAEPTVSAVSENAFGFEVDATAECYYDIHVIEGAQEQVLRIHLTCDDAVSEGCKTEFERLILLNRPDQRRGAPAVQIDRQARCADLQAWILDKSNAAVSFAPIVLGPDYSRGWRSPRWTDARDTIYSIGQFIHDPRPDFEEMRPPARFLEAREAIFAKIRGPDGTDLVEAAQLGNWLATDSEFASLIEEYVGGYLEWLRAEPEVAAWSDLLLVVSNEADGRTLQQEPDAVILSPLHPLRLGWQCLAQRTLYAASRTAPCPAATILDPDGVPDVICLPLRTADGRVKYQPFFAVECSSDYWSILWNAARLDRLAARAEQGPFDQEFGISVGGVANGFSVSQVRRALDDVSTMLVAKPILNILVASSSGQSEACNEGLLAWCREKFGALDATGRESTHMGARLVHMFDDRRAAARPSDASISNVAEDSSNMVRWFGSVHEGLKPDLGIIAQLETSSPSATTLDLGSPVGFGALIRHRVRKQLPAGAGAFLTETRSGSARPESGDVLADKIMKGVVQLEQLGGALYGYTFAPSVHAIQHVLKERRAAFAAVSSTAVDPACFLGGWLEDAYLWDYDLPSYSQRAGDTNGYYLLSKVKDVDRDTLRAVLERLPGCSGLSSQAVDDIIFEVARRGIPTVRGLSAGDSGASGDLGLFLAARLLQDEFRTAPIGARSLLPVIQPDDAGYTLNLIVPVDPFAGYLDDLRSATRGQQALRPDLIVASISVEEPRISCRLTPVEVKYRSGVVMQAPQCMEALQQAKALAHLLSQIQKQGELPDHLIWRLATQHALISMVGFAFRVYSHQRSILDQSGDWASFHQKVMAAILSDEIDLQIDSRGRLIVFDASASSGARDFDGDGFKEAVVVGAADAGQLIAGDPRELYEAIRSRIGAWDFRASVAAEIAGDGTSRERGAAQPYVNIGGQAAMLEKTPLAVGPRSPASDVVSKPSDASETPNVPEEGPAYETGDTRDDGPAVEDVESPIKRTGVDVLIGSTVDNFREIDRRVNLSDTNLNQLNIGVVGDLGTGKTQLLKSLIYQITAARACNEGIRPRFLIFDYKKDYSSPDFVEAVGARVVLPRHLPINLFDVSGIADSVAPWLDRFKFFTDVLDKIFSGIGPVQRQQLKNAVRQAYEDCGNSGRQPTIYDVHEKYKALLGNRSDAPLSIIDDLVDMEMFSPDPGSVNSLDEFLDGVVVISLAALGQDDRTKNMLVAIMLNIFYEHMLRIPKRPYVGTDPQLRVIDSFLLVDEADNIMRYEFDVLRKILLQGREFGVGVVLASQYLRHFKAGATDYREPLLTWFVHKVPNVTPQELNALGITSDVVELAERIRSLPMHHCMLKTLGVPGEIVRGVPFYKLNRG